jgi:hypothetical protein
MDTLTTWIGQHDVALAIVFLTLVVTAALGTISDALRHALSENRQEVLQHLDGVAQNLSSVENELTQIRKALLRHPYEDYDPDIYGLSVVEVLEQIRDRPGRP